MSTIPLRPLGRTGVTVSALGLGGYHIGLTKEESESIRIQHAALDAGINFFDNAWEYHDGLSEERMGKAIADRREKVFLMTKVCTHGRDKHEAMRQLEDSLRRLQTDHIDLWQVHELAYDNDPALHFVPDGVIEALDQAKQQGKVRFVGFTGHKSPEIHLDMLSRGYPFDACLMPLNVLDGTFRSFEQKVLPELARQGVAALGMKSMGGSSDMVRAGVVTAQEALRYVMSLPIATLVSGMASQRVLEQNLAVAQGFTPFNEAEMQALRERCRAAAADGRFELYKVSAKHEGPIGRAQHGFPPQSAMVD
ncbi:MAG: aldo/keto reductase [Acidobacteria bacterium]|nr:aldo/keto reductase [Acidobacteriota bacterium]